MQTIIATFEDGVFKPSEPLHLPAHTSVRLTIEPLSAAPLTVGQLRAFLESLPSLGDDADAFAHDVHTIRNQFPTESNPWD